MLVRSTTGTRRAGSKRRAHRGALLLSWAFLAFEGIFRACGVGRGSDVNCPQTLLFAVFVDTLCNTLQEDEDDTLSQAFMLCASMHTALVFAKFLV